MSGRASAFATVPGLVALARAQHGVVRRDQLAALGVTHSHVRTQVESRRWRTHGPRVVVLHTGPMTRDQHLLAAVLNAGESSSLAGRTALECAGLHGWHKPLVHVAVERGVRVPPLPAVVVHQSVSLPESDVVPGVPRRATSARAAVDAASWERHDRSAAGVVLAVVQQGLATVGDIGEVLERLGSIRRARAIREALLRAGEGSESLAEVDVERVVRSLGLGPVERQVVVEAPNGTWRLDLVVLLRDGRRLDVEVDGVHHLDPRQRLHDAARDAAVVALGYVVLRVPAWADRAWVRAQLIALAG